MIVGLDISTSITGITALDEEGNRLRTGFCDTRKQEGFFEKAKKQKHDILHFIESVLVDFDENLEGIYIEQSLQAFRPGLSSAKVLLALAGMNKIISFALFEHYDIEPEYIAATSARKLCGIKVKRGEKGKEAAFKFVVDNETDFVVQYTRHGNPKAQYYDMSDSIVIARAGYTQWKQNENSKS